MTSTASTGTPSPPPSRDDPLPISPPFTVRGLTEDTVILKASDDLRFKVDRGLLCATSAVFRDMISIPQPAQADDQSGVVSVAEPAAVLHHFLNLLSGSDSPPCASLDSLLVLALLSQKYEAPCVSQRLRLDLREIAPSDPLRAFAIAARFDWELEAKYISTLTHDLDIYQLISTDDMPHMKPLYFPRLAKLHQERQRITRTTIRSFPLDVTGTSFSEAAPEGLTKWWSAAKESFFIGFDASTPPSAGIIPSRISCSDIPASVFVLGSHEMYAMLHTYEGMQKALQTALPKSI